MFTLVSRAVVASISNSASYFLISFGCSHKFEASSDFPKALYFEKTKVSSISPGCFHVPGGKIYLVVVFFVIVYKIGSVVIG